MTRNRHMSTCNLVGVGYRNHKWNLWAKRGHRNHKWNLWAKRQVTFTHHGPEWWYATVPKFPYFFWCIRNAVISLHNKVHIVHLHHHTIHKLLTAHWWINFPHDLSHLHLHNHQHHLHLHQIHLKTRCSDTSSSITLHALRNGSEASSSITFYRGCIRSTWRHGVLILLQA